MLKTRNYVVALLLVSAILSNWACGRPIITLPSVPTPVLNSPTPTFTATFTSTSIPPSTTPTHWACYPLTCTLTLTGSPTPLPTLTPTLTPSPTQTFTSTAASTTSTSTPTITATIAVPAHTPVSVVKYLLSASSGVGSGMPVTYGLYCLGWYPVGPVTIIDNFDPGFTYNGPNPANTVSGPNFTTGANSVTMVWPLGLPTGASWVTFSVVEATVPPSEYCQVRTNQAQIIYQDAAGIHPFSANFSNDSVTMVCPAVTITPTPTPTGLTPATATITPTLSPTATPHTTPNPSIPSSGIFWDAGYVSAGGTSYLQMWVNGVLSTTDAVTLTTPSGAIGYTNAASVYYPSAPITYTPGGSYTLTTYTSIGTATATLIAPGGNITVAADGSTASWDVEGNEDWLTVRASGPFTYASYNYTSDIDQPFLIPATAYPASGTYSVQMVAQSSTYSVAGAVAGSRFTINQYGFGSVVK